MNAAMAPMKVLAVDDNRTNLHILQLFLRKLGHEVVIADNGKAAVERFIEDTPDLVLLDIMMPIMDGFEAAQRIKAMSRDRWIPIIFLSALNRDENLVQGLEAGADDYLTKPINFVVLEAKLRSMQRSLSLQHESIDALRRIQAISDNVLEGIVTVDAEGIMTSANRAMTRMFRLPAESLVGRSFGELLPEEFRARHNEIIGNYQKGNRFSFIGMERELLALRRDGSTFPITMTVTELEQESHTSFILVIRDISERKQTEEKLRENARMLQEYFDQTQGEQQLALRLMEKYLHRSGLQDSRLQYKVIPAANFSGDIVAAARSKEGRFYVLLADATGHGLAAAISVLPLLALFYRMSKLNREVAEIINELNQQLKESMPVGRFVAVALACMDESARSGEIWVGGTPDPLLFDQQGTLAASFASTHLPLGIVSSDSLDSQPVRFEWQPGSQLLLCSDGLLEAAAPDGEQFGLQKLVAAASGAEPAKRFSAIDQALATHLGDQPAGDDISLMLIDCI